MADIEVHKEIVARATITFNKIRPTLIPPIDKEWVIFNIDTGELVGYYSGLLEGHNEFRQLKLKNDEYYLRRIRDSDPIWI